MKQIVIIFHIAIGKIYRIIAELNVRIGRYPISSSACEKRTEPECFWYGQLHFYLLLKIDRIAPFMFLNLDRE